MAQLGRFYAVFQDSSGNARVGSTVTLYREGCTVNGNQSGTSPLAVTVRHAGKISSGDTVFVDAATVTSYSAARTSNTVITLSGFAGTLVLANGQRLVPSNNQPTLYLDGAGGTSTGNPLTTATNGTASCWMNVGAIDFIEVPIGSLTGTLFQGIVTPNEVGSGIVNVRAFGATGDGATDDYQAFNNAIQFASTQNGSLGGWVYMPAGTYNLGTGLTIPAGVGLQGEGNNATVLFMRNGANIDMISRSGSHGQFRYFRDFRIDGNKANNSSGRGIYWLGGFLSTYFHDILILNMPGRGLVLDSCDSITCDTIYVNGCGDTGIAMLDCTQCVMINCNSERSGAGSAAPGMWVRGGNSNVLIDTGIEQTNVSGYTQTASSIGLHLDSTIGCSVLGYFALGAGAATTDAILVSNTTTPSRSARYTLQNITQTSFTNIVRDIAVSPNQTSTLAGLSWYGDQFTPITIVLMAPTTGISWGVGSTVVDRTGTASPEGAVTAAVGSIFRRTDGGALTTLYVKESGSGNTGWIAK